MLPAGEQAEQRAGTQWPPLWALDPFHSQKPPWATRRQSSRSRGPVPVPDPERMPFHGLRLPTEGPKEARISPMTHHHPALEHIIQRGGLGGTGSGSREFSCPPEGKSPGL